MVISVIKMLKLSLTENLIEVLSFIKAKQFIK